QRSVVIGIYQGESELVADNLKLGEVELLFDPPRPRDAAVVDVTFHLDANDILHVTAKDRAGGASQSVTIQDSQNPDRETVDRLKREARRSRPAARVEGERVRRRQQWADLLADAQRRLARTPPGAEEHNQTAAAFARQLATALRAGDDDLAAI